VRVSCSRRSFLKNSCLSLSLFSTTVLMACTKKKEASLFEEEAYAHAKQSECGLLTGLSEADLNVRINLKYQEPTPLAGLDCRSCRLYKNSQSDTACGGCTLIKGPISPKAYCIAWIRAPNS